jgi:hypothetical protein
MSTARWIIRFSPVATRDKYQIPRGEAALFRDAVAVLYQGRPADAKPVPAAPNTYLYSRNGYLIAFEVLAESQTNRVLYFERE